MVPAQAPGLAVRAATPVFDDAYHAPVDAAASTWLLDEARTPRRGPLGPVRGAVLIVRLRKETPAFWPRLLRRHPRGDAGLLAAAVRAAPAR